MKATQIRLIANENEKLFPSKLRSNLTTRRMMRLKIRMTQITYSSVKIIKKCANLRTRKHKLLLN